MDLVIASSNEDKIKEIKEILKNRDINYISLKELNNKIDIDENGKSYKENAYIKAKTIYDIYKLPTLADDSGLEVDALNGAPGINSHRYSKDSTYKSNNEKLLHELEGVTNRKACFKCVSCLIIDGKVFYSEGTLEGFISKKASGTNGFGYDPYFMIDDNHSLADITDEKKNQISHRAKSLEGIGKILDEFLNSI